MPRAGSNGASRGNPILVTEQTAPSNPRCASRHQATTTKPAVLAMIAAKRDDDDADKFAVDDRTDDFGFRSFSSYERSRKN
jgi:hypothetical protein